MRSGSAIDTTLSKWFAWNVMFRALLLLWLLMTVFIFQHRGAIKHDIFSNSPSEKRQQYDSILNCSSEQQQQHDDPISRSSSEQEQLPSPLRTRTSSQSSHVNVVGLAEPTLRVGQQEQQLRRQLDPNYDDIIVWRRRMLKGSGTPSSPSDMNHGASKS